MDPEIANSQSLLSFAKSAGPLYISQVDNVVVSGARTRTLVRGRDGEVTFEKELSYINSYFRMRNLET